VSKCSAKRYKEDNKSQVRKCDDTFWSLAKKN
jgi:hypothetical protein